MMTWTTMVLAILLETTRPILVARRLVCCGVVVSAIYFFPFLELAAFPDFFTGLAAAFFAAGVGAGFFFPFVAGPPARVGGGAPLFSPAPPFFPPFGFLPGAPLFQPAPILSLFFSPP